MKESPARRRKPGGDGFHYVRVQNLDRQTLQGQDPVWTMNDQLQRFCPDSEYALDKEKSNEVFKFFKVPEDDYRKMEKGLQTEANARVQRKDGQEKLTSYNRAATDKIEEMEPTANLGSVAGALPSS